MSTGTSLPLLTDWPKPPQQATPLTAPVDFELRCADCREALPLLEDDSISLVLTDPPYFLDGMDDGWDSNRLRERSSQKATTGRAGVVGGLPVGMKFERAQGQRLYEFLLPIARQWLRVLKPGGFALCFSQPRLAHRSALALEDAGFEIRDMLAWRHEGQAKAFSQEHFVRKRDIEESEKQRIIQDLDSRKTPQLKPQMEMIVLAQAPRCGTFVDNWMKYRTGLIDTKNPLIEPGRFPGTVIPAAKPRERHGHLTPKPVVLLRHLIRIFCAEGRESVVLDPFAGSGATGVAALLEGRSFTGFEIDREMVQVAEGRLAEIAS